MTFQAYLDAVESKTGLTPRQLIAIAHEKGLDAPGVKAGEILTWLKDDYELGRGHGMAMVHLIQKGAPNEPVWLDGKGTKPTGEAPS
ncbi:MAG: DUF4287 domain-containing protein [Pseudolysinimonas sp.]